jgi:hypothetical protein
MPDVLTDDSNKGCRIVVPGITFTRSLNGAADHAKVSSVRVTLASEAKRDNFRDPDAKLSNNAAPVLLTKVDNKKPFTFTKDHTDFSEDVRCGNALHLDEGEG